MKNLLGSLLIILGSLLVALSVSIAAAGEVQQQAAVVCPPAVTVPQVAAVPYTVETRIRLRDRIRANRVHRHALRAVRFRSQVMVPTATACIGCVAE